MIFRGGCTSTKMVCWADSQKNIKQHQLVFYEECDSALSSIQREKQLKNWHRQWKINLIEQSNPSWVDLGGSWHNEGDSETSSVRLS